MTCYHTKLELPQDLSMQYPNIKLRATERDDVYLLTKFLFKLLSA